MLQSDQDIENEIINDIEDANTALAEQELQQLKDAGYHDVNTLNLMSLINYQLVIQKMIIWMIYQIDYPN